MLFRNSAPYRCFTKPGDLYGYALAIRKQLNFVGIEIILHPQTLGHHGVVGHPLQSEDCHRKMTLNVDIGLLHAPLG